MRAHHGRCHQAIDRNVMIQVGHTTTIRAFDRRLNRSSLKATIGPPRATGRERAAGNLTLGDLDGTHDVSRGTKDPPPPAPRERRNPDN